MILSFRRGFSCKWWRWGRNWFRNIRYRNLNENDESEINEKDEENVTLDDPIKNETKEVPAGIIDWSQKIVTLK